MPTLSLPDQRLVKALCVGYPGTGKTGAIASLANSGRFNLRVLNFDGETGRAPLLEYIKPEFYPNVEIVDLEDDLRVDPSGKYITNGPPKAYVTAAKLGAQWKYGKAEDGTQVDLGPVKSWTSRDVLVVDNLSRLNEAILRQIAFEKNRQGAPLRIQDWGDAVQREDAFLSVLAGKNVPCHVLVLAHIIMTGPNTVQDDDDDTVEKAKREQSALVPWRLFPRSVTANYSSVVAGHFPYLLHFEKKEAGPNKVRRLINPFSIELDGKIPLKSITQPLPIEDGLLRIFDAAAQQEKAAA